LGHRTALQKQVEDVMEEIDGDVVAEVARAKAEGAAFTLSGDCWKPKMKRQTHYLAVYLDWTSKEWTHKTVCAGVMQAPAPRNAECYHDIYRRVLDSVALSPSDVLAGGSDHDGGHAQGFA